MNAIIMRKYLNAVANNINLNNVSGIHRNPVCVYFLIIGMVAFAILATNTLALIVTFQACIVALTIFFSA
jgi:hypothetical protein